MNALLRFAAVALRLLWLLAWNCAALLWVATAICLLGLDPETARLGDLVACIQDGRTLTAIVLLAFLAASLRMISVERRELPQCDRYGMPGGRR